MGVLDRMNKLSAEIKADTNTDKANGAGSKSAVGSVTAPGGMALFRQQTLKHEETVRALEDQLAQFKDSLLTKKFDTSVITFSKWSNRHPSSFESKEFEDLKVEIEHAGGNIQPILIRSVPGKPGFYEIVFGHRRFMACKQLGLPVLAMVVEMSDEELFTLMDRENRHRLDPSAYEQGESWRRALAEELFPSARQLASHVGVSHGLVNQCLALARLPTEVLDCFPSPTALQLRWGKALTDLVQMDPEGLQARIAEVRKVGKPIPAAKVFQMLCASKENGTEKTEPKATPIKLKGKVVGEWVTGPKGSLDLSIKAGILDDTRIDKLKELVSSFMAG